MRVVNSLGVVLGMFVSNATCEAQENDYANPLLTKAIKALGNAKKQSQYQGFTCQSKMTIQPDENTKLQAEVSWSVQGLEYFRADLNVTTPDGQNISFNAALAGKKNWFQNLQNNTTQDIPANILPLIREDLRAVRLAQRPIFLRQKGYKLSPLGEMKIDKKDAVGLKISQKGRPDVDLFLEKKNGLPVQAAVRLKESDGNEVTHSFTFSDYKDVDGLKQFTRVVFRRDNQQVLEVRLSGVEWQENLGKGIFQP